MGSPYNCAITRPIVSCSYNLSVTRSNVTKLAEANFPTRWGQFRIYGFEGYFDVLRLVLAGIEHVVAPLGPALTGDQASLLRRFAPMLG